MKRVHEIFPNNDIEYFCCSCGFKTKSEREFMNHLIKGNQP